MSKLGVAGCGRMGLPMARAISEAGFNTQGFDTRPLAEFGDFQVSMAGSVTEFTTELTTLFTVVRDQRQTDDVLFNDQGLIAKADKLTHIVISSTLSPKYVRELRGRIPQQIKLIDAPMSGAAIAAEEKRLSFMLGGHAEDIAHIQPYLNAIGKHFHVMGAFGAGMAAKVLNNLLAASSTVATRLVLDWADELGVEEARLLDLMHTSSGQTWFGSNFNDIEFARDGFDPENTIGILKKDVEAAMDGAPDNADLKLPSTLIAMIEKLRPR
ncbi:3-hydroxyisobutyrate dehydrogenase [Rhodobacterales bacterium 52_120_T64]|nr:3-hydroxyisobutyrate dehydrogenase [Rhodobacterales bacterium 52_120_T64]